MVPNGSAYSNFPSFANNGTKTPPGGSTESAKYALGMVPADTFPAEWANYLFHGATNGISRLNQDTGSIKKEINTVLACENLTPDATCYDQLYCAMTKIRDEAVALAYPVGTVYINAKCSTLPTSIAQIGTWCAIDGRFLRACASCLGCTGGGSVTLAVCNLPSHCHTTPAHCHSGFNHSHCVDLFSGNVCSGTSGTINNTVWTGGTPYSTTNTNCVNPKTCGMDSNTCHCHSLYLGKRSGQGTGANGGVITDSGVTSSCVGQMCTSFNYTDTKSLAHAHVIGTHYHTLAAHYHKTTGDTSTVGSACNTGSACPTTCNTGSGCAFDIIPSYRDVAMWYRDA